MERRRSHQVVRVTVGGLMGPGPVALEKANEYISEAEHQEGHYYWDQFDYEAELADDVALYLTECGYLGDSISGAGGNSHPLVGWEPQEPKPEDTHDERLQDALLESNIKTDMDGNITCETCGEQIEPTSMLLRTGVQVYWFCENCETEYFVDLWFRSKSKQVRHPLKEAN